VLADDPFHHAFERTVNIVRIQQSTIAQVPASEVWQCCMALGSSDLV
jgi:hypothetical protein